MRGDGWVLTTIAVQGYRSLHDLRVPLTRLTVITGANGSGKSNLYRALRLLADCADRRVIGSLAREGGIQSALWAGPEQIGRAVRAGEQPLQGTRRTGPVSLQLGFATEAFSYLIDLGLPVPVAGSFFGLDPEIKRELIWSGPELRPSSLLVRRAGGLVSVRGEGRRGDWEPLTDRLRAYESVLTEINDPRSAPELIAVRDQVRSWRFYDQFRTDPDAPARQAQIGTRTPVLDADGRDLAAALRTIVEIGDADALRTSVEDAFPGSRLSVGAATGRFEVQLQGPGLLRPLSGPELSDGTLRYLLLVAALLSPRPPELMVLNEPETSLHPSLLGALGRLIVAASVRAQVVVVTHAAELADQLGGAGSRVELEKELGQTRVAGLGRFEGPDWSWGNR